MVIQEIPQQDLSNALPPGFGSISPAPEAIAPAFEFASAFSRNSGFAPTSILIEVFGSLADPAVADSIAAGILLGLAGIETREPDQSEAILEGIRTTKSILLNGWIEIPFIAAEHLILTPSALMPSHSDGIRLTAYHCMHAFITRQFYASAAGPLSFTEC